MVQSHLMWEVHKFGGTSVGNADCMQKCINIVKDAMPSARIAMVVSAMGGKPKVTDMLLNSVHSAAANDHDGCEQLLEAIHKKHVTCLQNILDDAPKEAYRIMDSITADLSNIRDLLKAVSLMRMAHHQILELVSGYGELWSAKILSAAMRQQGLPFVFINARDVLVVRSDESAGVEVEWDISQDKLNQYMKTLPKIDGHEPGLVITGYIASSTDGVATTLKRDGSDFSASIFGKLLGATAVTIWTDVSGVYSADPRRVPDAQIIDNVSYTEAIELAYFGAKVIHPKTMAPAIQAKIPIYIRNTFDPEASGTRIFLAPRDNSNVREKCVCGFSTVDNVALLNIEGTGMVGVSGIAMRLFSALEEADIPVLFIAQASSEHSICFATRMTHVTQAKSAIETKFYFELSRNLISAVSVIEDCSIIAAYYESCSSLKVLRSLGLGVNEVTKSADKATPLHIACQHMRLHGIRYLVSIGASLTQRNAKGFTPLQMFLRAWAHNITSMITQKPQEMIDLLHILISGPNDILDSEPYSNLISTTSEDGNNQTTFINFWSFESYSPFFIGACYLEASIFDELASIASIAPTKSLFRGEIAKTLMYSIYKRRIGGSLIILNRFSSLLFQEWDRAVELMTDLICVSIENGMMEVVAKLLELIHMHSNLEEVCFNPMPLFEALVFNDALILNMLLNHGFAHSILIPLTSMTNPRWRNVASFQYFCPLNIACLRNDATSVSKMIEKLPGSILSATHCLKSDTVSPLVCAMLVSSVACIETLKRFMRPREYSLACRVPDSCGFRPLSLLLSHIRISTSEQMSREYQYSESTVRCVYLIIQEMKNISFVRDQRYENNLTLWKQRSSWVRRRLSEAIDGQRSCKERIIATSSTMDFTQLRQEVVQLNERQERVKKYIDDKIFQIDLKLFQASIYNRNTGFLIHSFLIVFSKTIFTPNKNMEEDFLKFCNMSKAYDSFLIRVKNIEGIAKVLGPKAWHNAKHQFENIGAVRQNVNASNYRSCRFYDFLFQWVKLVLDYSALIFGYNLENTESADDEASMSERNAVIEAIKSEKFRNREIFIRKVLLYMPKFSSSTNSDYYCLSELVGSDKVEHSCSAFINGAFNLIKEMKWRGLWDAAGVQADDVPVVHKNSLKDTIATMIIQELKIGESETLLDGMGQSLTQALAINSCWDAALALISNIQSQRGHLRTHFEMCIYLHSTAISYLDKARYSRKYRTFPNNLDLLHPESWTDEDIWKEINMDSLRFHSIVDIALENRQNSFLRKYLNGCSKFVHDCSSTYLEKLASSIDAYDTCSIICTDLGDMTGCEAPVLMRRQGRSVDTLSTNYKSLRVPNHPETFNRCTAHQLDIPNHKIELARGLRSLLYDCHRVSHLLLNTEDIPINDEDVSTSLVDLVRPQMEGTLAGLCLNHDESSVLLQDGTYVPLETFLESKSLLLMSMPAPVMRGGPYCTGYNILHAACSHNEEGLALVMGILTVSTELTPKSCFMTDLLGKTPIYYALEQKNLKVAKFLLDYIKKGDISRPSEELSHVSNVLESSKKYPPKSVNVGGMYLPRAMRWLSYAQSRYRTVEAANQWESSMISNSSNGDYNNGGVIWPTVRDAMLLSSLKVLGRLWSKISDTSFVPHFHNLYITTFNVLGSVNCAKRILKALNFTPGRLQECAKLLSNPLPCHVQKLLPMETYLHVKDALQKWILQLNSDGQPRNATHCKIINTLVLYQLCSRKLQDLIELEREYDKNYQNFDLCHSICSGRGLPSLVMTDLRSYCTGEVSHSNLGGVGSSSLKTRLEEFLNIYRKDRLLVQETMNSAMTIIEFGRSLIMSRCLSVASNPPKSIDPSPYAGDECMDIRDFQHPLDHILNDLHRARECERNAMNLLNAMDNSAEKTVFQNMQSESNDPIALIERTQNKGAVTRISALDNVNIEMLDLLLLSKSEIGYRSESKKHIFKAIGLIYATFSDSRDIQSWFSLCQNDTKSDTYILSKSAVDIQREVDTKTSTKVHDTVKD